mgnify:CR=1 FL=1
MSAALVTPTHTDAGLLRVTHIVYALHALGLAIGAFGAATVLGSFLFGWPSIIAVILNYVKRGEAQGTWLESHFAWQIRTFWFALLWACTIFIAGLPLTLIIVTAGIDLSVGSIMALASVVPRPVLWSRHGYHSKASHVISVGLRRTARGRWESPRPPRIGQADRMDRDGSQAQDPVLAKRARILHWTEVGQRVARVLHVGVRHRRVLALDIHAANGARVNRVHHLDHGQARFVGNRHAPQRFEMLARAGVGHTLVVGQHHRDQAGVRCALHIVLPT